MGLASGQCAPAGSGVTGDQGHRQRSGYDAAMPDWLTFVAALLGGGIGASVVTWALSLWRDKVQEDRAIARERRKEARQLNRLRREKLAALYAHLVVIGEGLLARGINDADGAEESKFLEVYSQLTIEPGTERLTAAFQAFVKALDGPGEQASAPGEP